jgi:hypothetical protein
VAALDEMSEQPDALGRAISINRDGFSAVARAAHDDRVGDRPDDLSWSTL